MKTVSMIASPVIIVVANALALLHAAHNRSATEADIVMTQREVQYFSRSPGDDDSGVALQLRWTDTSVFFWPLVENPATWLDRQKLQELGFDCREDPASPDAASHYQRQRARQVFIALEYDGPAWRAWWDAYERAVAEQKAKGRPSASVDAGLRPSHLVAIDADLDPLKLRGRHPDRTAVVILPAIVAIGVNQFHGINPERPARVVGRIQQLPSSIHVPRPFSDQLRSLTPLPGVAVSGNDLSYQVHLRYGASLEPWVTRVEFH